jgi:hypothetical protein
MPRRGRRRRAARRQIRAAGVSRTATTPASRGSGFRERSSRAARTCARQAIAGATGRRPGTRSRSTALRAISDFAALLGRRPLPRRAVRQAELKQSAADIGRGRVVAVVSTLLTQTLCLPTGRLRGSIASRGPDGASVRAAVLKDDFSGKQATELRWGREAGVGKEAIFAQDSDSPLRGFIPSALPLIGA